MSDIDAFATDLFEEAKRFLEKARETTDADGRKAFLHAALFLGVSALEAHVNAIADEMLDRGTNDVNVLERSILMEQEVTIEKGEFRLVKKLKMYHLMDRIWFILRKFSGRHVDTQSDWWSKLHQGIDLRNSLVHPKNRQDLTPEEVESAFAGILGVLDVMYTALYKQHFPALRRRFDSRMHF